MSVSTNTQQNRFTLKFAYNGKPMLQNGSPIERNFDAENYDDVKPYHHIDIDKSWSHWADSEECKQAKLDIKNLMEHILWEGSSDFLSNMGANFDYKTKFSHILKSKGNYFTLILVDNEAFDWKRIADLEEFYNLKETLSKLESSTIGRKDSTEADRKQMVEVKEKLSKFYTKKELFSLDIPADQYTFDGVYHFPPIGKIWKDFNVLYESIDRPDNIVPFRNPENFRSTSCNYQVLKRESKSLLAEIETELDNVKKSILEKKLKDCYSKINKIENTCFYGLRSILRYALSSKKFNAVV